MNKEQENRFKENIKKIARQELKNSFTDNLMETLNSAFIFKYVQTLEEQSKKYKEVIDKAIEFTNKNWGTWCTHHLEYMTKLQNILKGSDSNEI